jgi:hypothetical protein
VRVYVWKQILAGILSAIHDQSQDISKVLIVVIQKNKALATRDDVWLRNKRN